MEVRVKDEIEGLRRQVKGRVLLSGEPGYDEARRIWNAMIDRRPAVIVQCADAGDVPHAIRFAREEDLEISIRGGGHNIAGSSLSDNGVTIDFSQMKKVQVDAKAQRAYAEPGATLHDFDQAVQAHGLATPLGINSTTGIAGLTLGGGFGWLTRQHGLTIDNLVSADLITADQKKVRASEHSNQDLFWAIRGGGGNFGVVTQFEFKLHPVGPEILAGLIVYPRSEAKSVLEQYREFVKLAPLDLTVWVVLRKAPPLPFLPASVHGQDVVILAVCYSGGNAHGPDLVRPLLRFGDALGEHVGPLPYVQWQQAFDPLLTPGARNYWKSHNFTELPDGALDTMIEYAGKMPSPQCEIFVGHLEGVANRMSAGATAYGGRSARFVMNVHGRWDDAAQDEQCIAWSRAFFKAAAPYASAGAYVNFMTEEESDRVAAAYGPNYARLIEIKKRYDPENVFHVNQNIKPGEIAAGAGEKLSA
ncbi:MAG TPA: FAD-binding oxidoreductase [Candidatus Angelobacter sp.]|nr:FAD-binding oxidoreductase [Candidatus Angelobacter sp.]